MTFQEWLQDQHADPKSTVWRSNADDLARAYAAGRESMREECVKACIEIATAPSNCTLGVAITALRNNVWKGLI